MAKTVKAAFEEFHDRINITGDHRETCRARKDALVDHMKKTLTIVDSFQSGSIPKYTALKTLSDLDVIVALNYSKHCKDKKPSEVLAAARSALSTYKIGARRNGQAVTVKYDTWPNVDIVPVYRVADGDKILHYCIPDMNTETWIEAKPVSHANKIDELAGSRGAEFRKIIKMMKWWNHVNNGYLESYHIEVLAVQELASFTEWSWNVYQFIEKMHTSISTCILSPCLLYDGSYADKYLKSADRTEVSNRLNGAKGNALSAWYATTASNPNKSEETAINLWRKVFGDKFPIYG
jgi:hypothetical protein